jgi:pyruvate dehydrogenase E1 component alpha subunit
VRQPKGRRIHALVEALGIPSSAHDGNDVLACHAALAGAVAEVRAGKGPRFLEFATYRWLEHCGPAYDNHLGYRSEAEFEAWKARDPIATFEARGLREGWLDATTLAATAAEVAAEVADAFAFAEASPFPEAAEAALHVYRDPAGKEGGHAPAHLH